MHKNITKPFILTIFGASGDLARLKIFPSLYTLAEQNRLPKNFFIVGYSRSQMNRSAFQNFFAKSVKNHTDHEANTQVLGELIQKVYYYQGQYEKKESFVDYQEFLKDLGCKKNMPHLTYLSVPPIAFKDIIKNLSLTKRKEKDDIRIIIEKPFGYDGESAENLFHFVSSHFAEDQFYLLDHYLGKSQVQSILNMRHSNRILSNIIKGSEVANIQITAFEDLGVENRISYFEQVGMVRDMIQSHLFQILALVTMSIPNKKTAESLHREKYSILSAIDCPKDKSIVLGQYKGYTDLPKIPKKSKTETFAAIRLFLDREEWSKVPIYIRTGKMLHEKHTYVVIELKKFSFQTEKEEPNRVIIEFEPEARINITLTNLQEGVSKYQNISTADSIACDIVGCLPAHGDLLLDVMSKDRVHFLSFPEILASWRVVDKIINIRNKTKTKIEKYTSGSMGPKSQNKLTKEDGFKWYDVHKNKEE